MTDISKFFDAADLINKENANDCISASNGFNGDDFLALFNPNAVSKSISGKLTGSSASFSSTSNDNNNNENPALLKKGVCSKTIESANNDLEQLKNVFGLDINLNNSQKINDIDSHERIEHEKFLLNNLAYFNGNAFRSENEIKSDVTTPVAASSSNLSVTSTSSNIVTKKQKNADSESNHPNNIQTPQNSTCFHENQLSYSAYLSLSNLNFDANTASQYCAINLIDGRQLSSRFEYYLVCLPNGDMVVATYNDIKSMILNVKEKVYCIQNINESPQKIEQPFDPSWDDNSTTRLTFTDNHDFSQQNKPNFEYLCQNNRNDLLEQENNQQFSPQNQKYYNEKFQGPMMHMPDQQKNVNAKNPFLNQPINSSNSLSPHSSSNGLGRCMSSISQTFGQEQVCPSPICPSPSNIQYSVQEHNGIL